MAKIKKCMKELKKLSKLKSKRAAFKKLIEKCDSCLIDSISEILLNSLSKENHFKLTKRQINCLRKHAAAIRAISQSGTTSEHRRSIIINQSGGSFIPLLVSLAMPLLNKILN